MLLLMLPGACGARAQLSLGLPDPNQKDAGIGPVKLDSGVMDSSRDAPATIRPQGSFDLRLHDVAESDGTPPPGGSPSEGAWLRLDLRAAPDGSLEALVTPRWGEPSAYDARKVDGGIALTGAGASILRPDSGGPRYYTSDSWPSIQLRTNAAGELILGETVSASGNEYRSMDDTGWESALTAKAEIRIDALSPEVRNESASLNGPEDALLAWDVFQLRAAEPVNHDGLARALAVTVGAAGVPAAWNFLPSDGPSSWGGVVRSQARATSWDQLRHGGQAHFSVAPAGSVTDLVGHPLASDFNAPIRFLDLGNSFSEITFTRGFDDVGSWGTVKWWEFNHPSKPCGLGHCMQLGPVELPDCGLVRTGIAGIRDVYVPAAVYRVWYRVFAEQLDPSGEVNAFTIETALPGAEPGTLSIGMPPLADLGASTTPLRYGSEVLTADVPLPAGLKLPGFIGYAIFVGDRRPCGQLSPPPVRVAVIIDHIGAPQ